MAVRLGVLSALEACFALPVANFTWKRPEELKLFLAATPVGHIPVLSTAAKHDFILLEQMISGRVVPLTLPDNINAFTISAKVPAIVRHRLVLLSEGGYCGLSASEVALPEAVWLEKSATIRLAHECSHYCTLRLFGGMKNHPLDELIADCMGQLAAFGCFRASLQNKFFGLDTAGNYCGGRLAYYCRRLSEREFSIVCRYIHQATAALDTYLQQHSAMVAPEMRLKLLMLLAGKGILPLAKGDLG